MYDIGHSLHLYLVTSDSHTTPEAWETIDWGMVENFHGAEGATSAWPGQGSAGGEGFCHWFSVAPWLQDRQLRQSV